MPLEKHRLGYFFDSLVTLALGTAMIGGSTGLQ